MMMGLGYSIPALALRRPAELANVPFSPDQIAPAAFFDPSRSETMFQDEAGANPVSANAQPLGRWGDLSGNGHDLVQATATARPAYRTDGVLHWVEMDGVDDALATLPVFNVQNPVTLILGYQMISTVGTSRVNLAEISQTSTNGMSIGIRPNIDRLQYYSRMSLNGVATTNVASPSIWGQHKKHVVTLQATQGQVKARLDGVQVIDTAQALMGQSIAAQPLRVGVGMVTGSIGGAFRLYGLQLWSSAETQPTFDQLTQLEGWMADKIGVPL